MPGSPIQHSTIKKHISRKEGYLRRNIRRGSTWTKTATLREIRQSFLNDIIVFNVGNPARCVVNTEVLKEE